MVLPKTRARRLASEDVGQLARAAASLLGLTIAISAAVGIGSVMGTTGPTATEPGSGFIDAVPASPTGPSRLEPAPSSGQPATGNPGRPATGGSDTGRPPAAPGGKGSAPSLPVEGPGKGIDVPGPVRVPTQTLPETAIGEMIDDLTGGDLLKAVEEPVATTGDTAGQLLP